MNLAASSNHFVNADADDAKPESGLRVKVVGVGDAGANMLKRLQLEKYPRVRRAAINTDEVSLGMASVEEKVAIGRGVTRGMSAGGETTRGGKAAEADRDAIAQVVAGNDLIFLLAGLGGGTGGGAGVVVAQQAVMAGCMVMAFVSMPFAMEGTRRANQAQSALSQLRLHCEAVIPVYNDSLMLAVDSSSSALDTLLLADAWIGRGIGALCAMLFKQGLPNIDFATLRGAFPSRDSKVLFVLGHGSGTDGLKQALGDLLNSPLLQKREVRQVSTIVLSFQSGAGLPLPKIMEAINKITENFGGRENTLFSTLVDEPLGDVVEICAIGAAGGVRRAAQMSAMQSLLPTGFSQTSVGAAAPVGTPERAMPAPVSAGAPATVAPGAEIPGKPKKWEQELIPFEDPGGRGKFFKNVPSEPFEGENLDVPTYWRRGLKLA